MALFTRHRPRVKEETSFPSLGKRRGLEGLNSPGGVPVSHTPGWEKANFEGPSAKKVKFETVGVTFHSSS